MEKKENNWGCIIIFIIYIIGNIVYLLSSTSDEEFADIGKTVMFVISIIITIVIFSYIGNKSDKDKGKVKDKDKDDAGCGKALLFGLCFLIVLGLIFYLIGDNFVFNKGIGIIILCIIAIIISICLWVALFKDD